jgi:hypothetical protein
MDAFTYQRLSLDRYGTSPNCATQEAENREYAEAQGDVVVDSFKDNDISISQEGRKVTKPRQGYPDMLAAIEAHPRPCKIIVTEMSRLYRDPRELIPLFDVAARTQLKKIETTDGMYYDLSTGLGIHNAITAVSSAALESRKISDRLKPTGEKWRRLDDPTVGTGPMGTRAPSTMRKSVCSTPAVSVSPSSSTKPPLSVSASNDCSPAGRSARSFETSTPAASILLAAACGTRPN